MHCAVLTPPPPRAAPQMALALSVPIELIGATFAALAPHPGPGAALTPLAQVRPARTQSVI